MNKETLDHGALLRLVEAGAVRAAHVAGLTGGWGVTVQYGATERPLAATRSKKMRVFKRLETVVTYLKEAGISRFDVDAESYDPAASKRSRPDRAEAMTKAHQAAAYTAWLTKEAQEAIDDPRPGIPHEEVMRRMDERIRSIALRKADDVSGDVPN